MVAPLHLPWKTKIEVIEILILGSLYTSTVALQQPMSNERDRIENENMGLDFVPRIQPYEALLEGRLDNTRSGATIWNKNIGTLCLRHTFNGL